MPVRFRLAGLLAVVVAACSSNVEGIGAGAPNEPQPSGSGSGSAGEEETPSYSDLVVFTTKASLPGDLGGLSGADARCNTYAKAAGLSGRFRAWLSDSRTDAISRVPEGGPWRVLDSSGMQGAIAFENKASWEGYPKVAIANTEFGKTLSELNTSSTTSIPYTWTGTELGGKRKGCHCKDWTSSANPSTDCADGEYGGVIGSRYAARDDETWTNFGANPCDAPGALLCFQVP